jgi:hypothetical protein
VEQAGGPRVPAIPRTSQHTAADGGTAALYSLVVPSEVGGGSAPAAERGCSAAFGVLMRLSEMKQPRVERLGYHVHGGTGIQFDAPPDLEFHTPEFHWKLSGSTLSLIPKAHFATESDARAAAEPLLRAWEIQAGLDAGAPVITFEFGTIRFIDATGDSSSGYALDHRAVRLDLDAALVRRYSQYPLPPSAFAATPDIETLWFRYSMYRQCREPLQSMAYFCFTVLTSIAGGLDAAAKLFNIHRTVLRKLSELSTTTGDASTGRKKTRRLRPPTPTEKAWLEAVIPAIIRAMGTAAAMGSAPTLDMSQLPRL